MKSDKNKKVVAAKPAKSKKAPKVKEPVIGSIEGLVLGDINFTVFGYRVTASQLAISKVGRVNITEPEVIACRTTKNTSQRKRS